MTHQNVFSPYWKFKLSGRPFDPSVPLSLRLYPALFYFTFALAGICGGLGTSFTINVESPDGPDRWLTGRPQNCKTIKVHQFFPHTNDFPGTPIGWEILWRITVIMTGFSGAALVITALNLIATEWYGIRLGRNRWRLKLWGGLFAITVTM